MQDRIVPPAFFDTGFDGSWLDELQFTSWIVSDDGRTICNQAWLLARNPAAVLSAPAAAFADDSLLHGRGDKPC